MNMLCSLITLQGGDWHPTWRMDASGKFTSDPSLSGELDDPLVDLAASGQ